MKCNAKLCRNEFSMNVSILAVVFRQQFSKNGQFQSTASTETCGYFQTNFSYLFFCQYLSYHWVNYNVVGLSNSLNVSFFIYPCRQIVFCDIQEYAFLMHLNLKHKEN